MVQVSDEVAMIMDENKDERLRGHHGPRGGIKELQHDFGEDLSDLCLPNKELFGKSEAGLRNIDNIRSDPPTNQLFKKEIEIS